MERWTAVDPAGALRSAGGDRDRKTMVLRQWAHRDPAAALAAAGGSFDAAIQQGIMETDPDHAYSRWQELAPGKPFPITTLEFALKSQVRHDPETAMRQVPADQDGRTNEIRGEMFRTWLDQDPDAALKFAEAGRDPKVRQQLLSAFAERFPDRAESLLGSLEGGDKSAVALAAAQARASQDLEAAARWLQGKIPVEEFPDAIRAIAWKRQGMTGEELGDILKLCPDTASADSLLSKMSDSPALEAVKNWLESQPAGSLPASRQLLAFKVLPSAEATDLMAGAPAFTADEGARMLEWRASTWDPGNPDEVAAAISGLPESMRSLAAGNFVSETRFWDPRFGGMPRRGTLTPENTAAIFAALPPEVQAGTALNFAWKQQSDPAAAASALAL